jgi:choline dehydrogenase-like flavoprotein
LLDDAHTGYLMIKDLERGVDDEAGTFDTCIVGAGAAGIVLAVELLRQGKRILLLESGGLGYERRTQALYRGETVGLPYPGMYDGRFRAFGGTTIEWGGQILELDEFDFPARPWIPGSGWPFEKAELSGYYARALEYEGLTRAGSAAHEIWRELGLAPPDFGGQLVSAFSRWCPRTNFARLFAKTLEESRNASVYLHANACKLILAADGETVDGVLCRTLTGKEVRFAADRFVLCMGGIESSRFLLQPHTHGAAPWNKNGLVGRYFQDHVSCFAADIHDLRLQPAQSYFNYVFAGGYKYHHKIKLAPAIQREFQTLNVCGTVAFVDNDEEPLERAYRTVRLLRKRRIADISTSDFVHLVVNAPYLAWHLVPYRITPWRPAREAKISMKLCVHCEQSPYSESSITLSPERDALGLYHARVDWRTSDHEVNTIRTYVDIVRDVFSRQKLGRVEADADLTDGKQWIEHKVHDSYHHMGGTRMATDASAGVVDPNLRLFGMRNAYVCSSSVFPNSGYANPTHTLLALAIRLADHLNEHAPTAREIAGPAVRVIASH